MAKMFLLNSAVITNYGTFNYTPLTVDDLKFLLNNRGFDQSAIGYQETAEALKVLAGITQDIPVSREQITMQSDDTAIVFRLTFRADPTKKGEYTSDFIAANSQLGFLHHIDQPNEIVQLALRVAKLQRNEDHVQPLVKLIERYEEEKVELEKAEQIWDELPDIYYYATVGYEVYGWFPLLDDMHKTAVHYDVSWRDMKKACIAKYRLRAAGIPKNIEAERAAILKAIAE